MFRKLEPEAKLIEAASVLRHLAQPEYDRFVAAMLDHARRASEDCINSSAENVRYQQGRAIEAHEFASLFQNITSAEAKLRSIKKGHNTP